MSYSEMTNDGERMFSPVYHDVWQRQLKHMNGADVKVYVALLAHTTQKDRTWFMSIQELAEDAGVSPSTASAAKDRLVEAGLILQSWRYRDEAGDYHLTDTRPPPRMQGKNIYTVSVHPGMVDTENRDHASTARSRKSESIESENRNLVESENRKQTVAPPPKPPTEPHPPLPPKGADDASVAGGEQSSLIDPFDEWWKHVNKKQSKGDARKAFKTALKKADLQTLINGIQRSQAQWQREQRHRSKTPHPATWLRAEAWLDEIPDAPDSQPSAGSKAGAPDYDLDHITALMKGKNNG